MIFSKKDFLQLIAIAITTGCAALICNLFLTYLFDLSAVESMISEPMREFYDAMYTNCVVVSGISGGTMIGVTLLMLVFYVKTFVDNHNKELGVLKALGYSSARIAVKFWVYPASVFIGTSIGYALSFIFIPAFYKTQNEDSPFHVEKSFSPELLFYIILIPTIAFAIMTFIIAVAKLRTPAIALIKGEGKARKHKAHIAKKQRPFLKELSTSTLFDHKLLLVFAILAPFCWGTNVQMGITMNDYTSGMMCAMMIIIGVLIAIFIMYLSLSSLVSGNEKAIAMMRLSGYTYSQCRKAILDGYRPLAYIGFAVGTVYQAVLLRFMVDEVFAGTEGIKAYSFSFVALAIALVSFVAFYELFMYVFSKRIERINPKMIMLE